MSKTNILTEEILRKAYGVDKLLTSAIINPDLYNGFMHSLPHKGTYGWESWLSFNVGTDMELGCIKCYNSYAENDPGVNIQIREKISILASIDFYSNGFIRKATLNDFDPKWSFIDRNVVMSTSRTAVFKENEITELEIGLTEIMPSGDRKSSNLFLKNKKYAVINFGDKAYFFKYSEQYENYEAVGRVNIKLYARDFPPEMQPKIKELIPEIFNSIVFSYEYLYDVYSWGNNRMIEFSNLTFEEKEMLAPYQVALASLCEQFMLDSSLMLDKQLLIAKQNGLSCDEETLEYIPEVIDDAFIKKNKMALQ